MKLNHLVAGCLIAGTITMAGCSMGTDNAVSEQEAVEENVDVMASAEEGTSEEAEDITEGIEESAGESSNTEEASEEISEDVVESTDTVDASDNMAFDVEKDYTQDIKADVDAAVASAASLEEELGNIDKVTDRYVDLFKDGITQYEMNIAESWYYTIWDTELNSLWDRFSDMADETTKVKVLADQRAWISMKDEVVDETLGSPEDNGSMYPLNKSALLEDITKTRCYFIAKEIADIKGEEFSLPSAPKIYGAFVDNQGTDSVYSALITHAGYEGDDEAKIVIYREGEVEGTFVDNGDGTLTFTANDDSVKGTITINGWDGATFEVDEDNGNSFMHAGDKYEFPLVF